MKIFSVFIIILTILGCQINNEESSVPKIEVKIERFDKKLMAVKDKDDLYQLLSQNEDYLRRFYRAYPDDTALINHLDNIVRHPETQKLHKEVLSTFGDLGDIEKELGLAFGKIKKNFPDFVPPKVVATFSGLENDLYVSDSVVYIALEAFLGPKASYRPQQPDYILTRYQKEYIVPTVIRFISDKYNKMAQNDATLLSDMIYFGKAFEFTKEMLPKGSDSLIIAYPDSAMQQTWNAQDLVWAHFIDKSLLYEKRPQVKEKYIGERPKVLEIGPACPGRVGQWVGWRIVQRYLSENPAVTLKDLMANQNAQEIFIKSKYRGQVED